MRKKGQFRVVETSDTETGKARRWSGFVCPDCRFVFRVPRDHDGEGIVCPSCRRMLRIPKEGEETAPLMAPLQKVGFAEDDHEPRGEKRTRSKRKRKKMKPEVPDWDPASGKWKMNSTGRKRTLQNIATWIGALAALVASVYLFKKAGESERSGPPKAAQEAQVEIESPVSVPLVPPEGDASGKVDPPPAAEE